MGILGKKFNAPVGMYLLSSPPNLSAMLKISWKLMLIQRSQWPPSSLPVGFWRLISPLRHCSLWYRLPSVSLPVAAKIKLDKTILYTCDILNHSRACDSTVDFSPTIEAEMAKLVLSLGLFVYYGVWKFENALLESTSSLAILIYTPLLSITSKIFSLRDLAGSSG